MEFTFKPSSLGSLKRPQSDESFPDKKIKHSEDVDNTKLPNTEIKLKPPTFFTYSQAPVKSEDKPSDGSLVSKYIFGQNIASKVLVEDQIDISNDQTKQNNAFSELAKQASSSTKIESESNLTLDESAAQIASKNGSSSKNSEPIKLFTGEEDESTQFEKIVVVYMFDKNASSWTKLGVGLFHLNDKVGENKDKSRIVIRNSSTFKVMVNTIIWPKMHLSSDEEKSIRISAMSEDNSVKIYTLKSKPEEAILLYEEIYKRIQISNNRHKDEFNSAKDPEALNTTNKDLPSTSRKSEDNDDESSLSSEHQDATVLAEKTCLSVDNFDFKSKKWNSVSTNEESFVQIETSSFDENQKFLYILKNDGDSEEKTTLFSSCLSEGFHISNKDSEEILGIFYSDDFDEEEKFNLIRIKFKLNEDKVLVQSILNKVLLEISENAELPKSKAFVELSEQEKSE